MFTVAVALLVTMAAGMCCWQPCMKCIQQASAHGAVTAGTWLWQMQRLLRSPALQKQTLLASFLLAVWLWTAPVRPGHSNRLCPKPGYLADQADSHATVDWTDAHTLVGSEGQVGATSHTKWMPLG
jgi:hypothetical protein